MPMTIPIRAFPIYAGASVDDENRQMLLTCLREEDAERAVRWLEDLKRAGALVPGDAEKQFFTVPLDTEVAFDVSCVNDLLARGVKVRSVVLASADVPADRVLAKITGGAADPPDPAISDPPAENPTA